MKSELLFSLFSFQNGGAVVERSLRELAADRRIHSGNSLKTTHRCYYIMDTKCKMHDHLMITDNVEVKIYLIKQIDYQYQKVLEKR